MNRKRIFILVAMMLMVTLATMVLAQRGGGRGRRFGGGGFGGGFGGGGLDLAQNRNGVETWPVDRDFPEDCFTFVRIMYEGAWTTDYPDADLNFSFRLQQLTSLKVNPNPITLTLTDDQLFDYPFIYIVEPGRRMNLSEDEVTSLRRYLLNGGFLMVDDFWGEDQWQVFYTQIKRVFPDREPKELETSHEVFHSVFDLKEKFQIPSIGQAQSGRATGRTWEAFDAREAHYRGIFDDKGRMMVMICHNTDLGDGWEREGEDEWYFREFSEKKAYPMGINIIFYAMTH